MEISQAKAKINALIDPKIKGIAHLFLDLGIELIACGEDAKIKKEGHEIGKLDLVFKDPENKVGFVLEVSTRQSHTSEKINSFFSRWMDSANLRTIKTKFFTLNTHKIKKIFFELSGDEDIHESVKHNLNDPDNKIFLDYDFKYFKNAYEKVGIWAKNDLYAFIGVDHPFPRTTSNIEAFQFYLGNVRAYLFLDRVDRILKYSYIFRRLNKDRGYQRILEKGRIDNIAKGIRGGHLLAFPNTVLISCGTGIKLYENPISIEQYSEPKQVTIKIPNHYCVCRIIDGQHRLLGFSKLEQTYQESHFLPVIALEEIGNDKEMKTFININSTQKKIDRNLILTLTSDFAWDRTTQSKEFYEKQTVEVIKKLNAASHLKNRIYIPEALAQRKGKITLATLVSAIMRNNLIGGRLHLYQTHEDDINTPFHKINQIFGYLNIYLPNYSSGTQTFFLSNQGLRVLFRLIQIFERNKLINKININVEDFIRDLKLIFNNRLVKSLKKHYGEGGANKATGEIFKCLKKRKRSTYGSVATTF